MKEEIRRNEEVLWVSFRDTTFSRGGLMECLLAIEGLSDVNKISSDDGRDVYDIKMWSILLWYSNKEERDKDVELINDIKKEENLVYQVPNISWEFEKDGKFYLIFTANFRLEWITNDYIYKWMIINPKKYITEQMRKELDI